jgi:carbonic anhydrase
MQLIVKYEGHRRHNEAMKACVIGCFDPRFQHPLKAYLAEFGLSLAEADFISVGGGVARNAGSENAGLRDDVLQQAVASVKLHRAPKAFLTSHEDCGALGGSAHFGSESAELAWHKELLRERGRTLEALIAAALVDWKKNGVTVAGKFIPPEVVSATYPEKVAVETAFLRFDGAYEL